MRGLRRRGSAGANARERWGARALSRARHGGGKVAAAELDWRRGERRRDPARKGVGPRVCGGSACGGAEAGAGLRPSSAADGAALRRRQRKQGGREVEDEGWTSL